MKMNNKKGNIAVLTAVGWGLTAFAVFVGIGLVVLRKMSTAVISCPTAYPTWNESAYRCMNATGSLVNGNNSASDILNYVGLQMGSTGLAGWIPVVIVILIAGIVLALFGGKKNY